MTFALNATSTFGFGVQSSRKVNSRAIGAPCWFQVVGSGRSELSDRLNRFFCAMLK